MNAARAENEARRSDRAQPTRLRSNAALISGKAPQRSW